MTARKGFSSLGELENNNNNNSLIGQPGRPPRKKEVVFPLISGRPQCSEREKNVMKVSFFFSCVQKII